MGGVLVVGTFAGAIALGFAHPLVMLSLSCVAIYVASEPAGEVEDGLVDLIVARPVPRFLIVTRSAFVFAAGSAAVVAAMFATSRIVGAMAVASHRHLAASGTPGVGRSESSRDRLVLRRRVARDGLAASVSARAPPALSPSSRFLSYLLQFGAAAWTPLRPFARVSPFHYYEPMQTLLGRRQTGRVIFLAC